MSYGELNIDLVEYSTWLKNNPLVEYSITIALHDQQSTLYWHFPIYESA